MSNDLVAANTNTGLVPVDRDREEATSNNNNRHASSPKHSQAYFEDRIAELKAKIVNFCPSQDDLDQEKVFLPLLSALEACQRNLDSTNLLKKKLSEQQKKHPDDDGYAQLTDPLNQAIDQATESMQDLQEAATNAALAMVRQSGLVDSGSLLQIQNTLLECTVLVQATPQKLADWCAADAPRNGKLLDDFLANADGLMTVFVKEGGPSNGNYGPALEIYDQLQQTELLDSSNSKSSSSLALKYRLAVAVALELATPVPIFKQEDTFVDPLERFRYYAKFAENNGNGSDEAEDALDEAFYDLSVWELRKVVDVNATHEDLDWGRQYLKNYRPDEISMSDQKWRYVWSVRTDVGYRHPDHDFNTYQELLSAGGECGPRAFFGRFVSKAWGIPTWGCRQPGHAAMTRYTKDKGWVVCLGAGWPYCSWEDTRFGGGTRHGPDFFEETQARTAAESKPGDNVYYQQVVLMECLAEIQGETVEESYKANKFWRSLALAQRRQLAQEFAAAASENEKCHENFTANTGICNKDEATLVTRTKRATIHSKPAPAASMRISHSENNGTFVIPAASFVNPPSKNVMILQCFGGDDVDQQLHLEHNGAAEYQLSPSVMAGSYELSARVVNVHRNQVPLVVEVESSFSSPSEYELIQLDQELEVPYTKGYWQDTQSIRVDLGGMGGKLKFSRSDPCWGLSIKEFFLKPVAGTRAESSL